MEFDRAVKELETLIGTLERENDERAMLLLDLIDAIHRPAIELIANGDLEHPVALAVLSMYDLVEVDEEIEVEEALDEIRPYIESHGGGLELLGVEEGVVHVRLSGSCNGCAGSAITLRRGVEEILREHYANFKEVVAHEPEEDETAEQRNGGNGGPQLLQIEGLKKPEGAEQPQGMKMRRPVFVEAGKLEELAPGELKAVDVEGTSVLIINVEGEPYAFKNHCALEARLPLDGGRLAGSALVCPWHNCAYDARSGKRVDGETDAPSLAVVPVAIRDGVLQVAVNVA